MSAATHRAAVLTPTAALRWTKRQDEVRQWLGDRGEIAVHGSILLHLAAAAAAARRDGDVARFLELATEADRWTTAMWRWVQPALRTRHVAGADTDQARRMVLALAEEATALLGDGSERPWVGHDAQAGLLTALAAASDTGPRQRLVAGEDHLTSGVAHRLGVAMLSARPWLDGEDEVRVPRPRSGSGPAREGSHTRTVLAPGAATHVLSGSCGRPDRGQTVVLVDVLVAVLVDAVRGTSVGAETAEAVVQDWWASGIVPVAPSLADYRRAALSFVVPFFDAAGTAEEFDAVDVDQTAVLTLAVVEGLRQQAGGVRVLLGTPAEQELFRWAALDGRWEAGEVEVEVCCPG